MYSLLAHRTRWFAARHYAMTLLPVGYTSRTVLACNARVPGPVVKRQQNIETSKRSVGSEQNMYART